MSGKKDDKKPAARAPAAAAPAPAAAAPAPAPAPAAAAPAPAAARVWRSAKDPKTGRTYYYDVLTRETRWTKPRELQGEAERRRLDDEKKERRKFFDEMERNMRKNFAAGLTSVDIQEPVSGLGWKPPQTRPSSGSIGEGGTRLVRTLSTVDDAFLFDDPQDGGRGSYASGSQTCRSRRRRSLSPQTAAWWGEVEATKQGPRAAAAAREQGKQNRSQRTVSFAEEKESLARDLAAGAPAKALAKPEVARSRNST